MYFYADSKLPIPQLGLNENNTYNFFYIVTYIFPNHRNIIIITFVCDSIVLEMFIKFLDPHSFTAFNVFLHVQRVLCC